jgi:hypothetical protein
LGVEEFLGHALPGRADERLEALQKRVDYLRRELDNSVHDSAEHTRPLSELTEARRQLAEFRTQHDRRN